MNIFHQEISLEVDGEVKLKFCIVNGFRNIQNIVQVTGLSLLFISRMWKLGNHDSWNFLACLLWQTGPMLAFFLHGLVGLVGHYLGFMKMLLVYSFLN